MGGRGVGGGGPGRRARGGRWGGAPESSVGEQQGVHLAGDEGGGGGQAWGGWAREAGKGGGDGGGTREQCGRVPPFWAPLKT